MTTIVPKRKDRRFFENDFVFSSIEDLIPYMNKLEGSPIQSISDLENLIWDVNEFGKVIGEEMRWRLIRMTCDTHSEERQKPINIWLVIFLPS